MASEHSTNARTTKAHFFLILTVCHCHCCRHDWWLQPGTCEQSCHTTDQRSTARAREASKHLSLARAQGFIKDTSDISALRASVLSIRIEDKCMRERSTFTPSATNSWQNGGAFSPVRAKSHPRRESVDGYFVWRSHFLKFHIQSKYHQRNCATAPLAVYRQRTKGSMLRARVHVQRAGYQKVVLACEEQLEASYRVKHYDMSEVSWAGMNTTLSVGLPKIKRSPRPRLLTLLASKVIAAKTSKVWGLGLSDVSAAWLTAEHEKSSTHLIFLPCPWTRPKRRPQRWNGINLDRTILQGCLH